MDDYVISQELGGLYRVDVNGEETGRCDLLTAEELEVIAKEQGCQVRWVYLEDMYV